MNIPDISPLYTNNWQTILGQKTFNNLISWIHEEDEITVTKNFLDLYSFVMYDYYTHEQYLQILNELEDSHVLILKNIPVVIENTYQDIIELNKQQQLYDAITSSIPLYIFLTSFENNPNLTLSTKEALHLFPICFLKNIDIHTTEILTMGFKLLNLAPKTIESIDFATNILATYSLNNPSFITKELNYTLQKNIYSYFNELPSIEQYAHYFPDFVQKDYFETKTAYPITISLNLNLVLSQYNIHVDHFQNIFNNVIYLLNSFNSTIPYFSNIAFTTTEALLNSPSLSKNFVFEKEKDSLEVRDSIKLVFDTLFTQLSQNPHFTITDPSSYINNCLLYQSLNNTLSIKNKQDKLPKVKI